MDSTEILGGLLGLFMMGCMAGMGANFILCTLIVIGCACYANL